MMMMPSKAKKEDKVKIGSRCYIGEHAVPSARWLENVVCPYCGCKDLMDAQGAALCVKCNKFVKPKKA